MKITKKTEKQYLQNPHFCPVCGTIKIIAGDWEAEGAYQRVFCDNGHQWDENFTMTSIEIRD